MITPMLLASPVQGPEAERGSAFLFPPFRHTGKRNARVYLSPEEKKQKSPRYGCGRNKASMLKESDLDLKPLRSRQNSRTRLAIHALGELTGYEFTAESLAA